MASETKQAPQQSIATRFSGYWWLALCLLASQSVLAKPLLLFPADASLATPIEVQIQLPVKKLRASDLMDPEEFPGELRLADGTLIPIKISARGKSRRKHCKFPPLRLNFSKAGTQGTIFSGQDKLKLVSHCAKGLAKGPYLASEMLAYRLLNLVTDLSFRVRALNVTYVDSAGGRVESRHAFLIEHKKQLADRIGMSSVTLEGVRVRELDARQAALVSVYQFMIGNADFSLRQAPQSDKCCHNVVPYVLDPSVKDSVVGIPYDFDASGFVNAPYAEPPQGLGLKVVTQRRYRRYCAHNDAMGAAIEKIGDQRATFTDLVASFNDIPGLRRKRAQKYLAAYFAIVDDSRQVNRKMVKRCR
jgi:hypothetical protein